MRNKWIALGTAAALFLLPTHSAFAQSDADYDIGSESGAGTGYVEGCCAPNYNWLGIAGAAAVVAGAAILIANIDDSGHAHS